MNEQLRYCKIRKVKSLNRGTNVAAGIDFYVPEDLTAEVMREKALITGCEVEYDIDCETSAVTAIVLQPGQSVMIPSGIKMKIPHGYALAFMNKSGVGCKKQLDRLAELVDEDYEGEVHINIINNGISAQKICAGDKIIQGVIIPVSYCMPVEVENAEVLFSGSASERGEGGFGSTGTK